MRTLASFLFWFGVVSIPLSILFWFIEPNFGGTEFADIADPAMREAFEAASSQRLAIFVGLWPPTLFILSNLINKMEVREEVSDILYDTRSKTQKIGS